MKAEEVKKVLDLMIGDWVMINPISYYQVEQIRMEFGELRIYLKGTEVFATENEIMPIPLTPEILEKNGFVANKHVYPYPYYEYINEEHKLKVGFTFPQGNRTSYKEPWVYIDSEHAFVEHLPCVFVHQLQHALRLCGIEKTIEL